ncbi:MAG: DUF2500 domain-containing protein [Oscillospiraceae bacterium]|jgi:hypothetical protein|nr:DUF2500 domain-containing protein [Oscillospiraceae bacterium]
MPFGFNIMTAVFPIAFIAVLAVIAVIAVRGLMTWSKNNNSPRIPAYARVVSKREEVTTQHHDAGNGAMHMYHNTQYYVTFEFASGDRQEVSVPRSEFGYLADGDEGVLTLQGTRFIGFERK